MTDPTPALQWFRAIVDDTESDFEELAQGFEESAAIQGKTPLETVGIAALGAWSQAFGQHLAIEMLRAMLFGYQLRGKVDAEMLSEPTEVAQ